MHIAILAGYLQTADHNILGVKWITGVNDWIHSTQNIKVHLDFLVHHCSVISEHIYVDERGQIDKEHEHLIAKEANFWCKVLQRIVYIIFTLAAEILSSRGLHEIQGELGSGHFLAHVELVAKYDLVIKDPLDKPKGSVRYLSPTIQNELIALLVVKTFRQHLIKEI